MIATRHLVGFAATLATLAAAGTAAASGDPAKGATVFNERCSVCHTVGKAPHGMGPNLQGVTTRKAGTAPGFAYSDALKKSGLVWNHDNLESFLTNPGKKVPGTRMMIRLPNDADRDNVVAYLSSLKK